MNWTKPNFTQAVTIGTLLVSFGGYVWHTESSRVEGIVKQHDQEQRVDSIATALAIFISEFRALQKDRATINKQRDQDKKEVDDKTNQMKTDIIVLKTEFYDYLKYKNQTK